MDTEDFTVADDTKLVTNKVFNHEVQWAYEITVRETDRETNESLEKTYDIFINDLNEAPTDLRITGNTFYREDGVGTKIGQLLITDDDRQDEHHVSITQGGEYVGYDDGYLQVLQLFDQTTKEIAIEVTDRAGLAYTETFEIRMKERPIEPSEPSEPTSSIRAIRTPVNLRLHHKTMSHRSLLNLQNLRLHHRDLLLVLATEKSTYF